MGTTSKYFLLTMGEVNSLPIKFWTLDGALDHVYQHAKSAMECQYLMISSDSGQVVASKVELLSIVRARTASRWGFALLLTLLTFGFLTSGYSWGRYVIWLFVLVFLIVCIINSRLVIDVNRVFFRNFFRR